MKTTEQIITAKDGRKLRVKITVNKVFYCIMVADPRYPMWDGTVLASNGQYISHLPQDGRVSAVRPVRYKNRADAEREARKQIKLSRQVGLGRGFGLMHSVTLLHEWDAWSQRQLKAGRLHPKR